MNWKTLQHPNVLPLLGVTMYDVHFAMISEWMSNGNINEFIEVNRDKNRFELVRSILLSMVLMLMLLFGSSKTLLEGYYTCTVEE